MSSFIAGSNKKLIGRHQICERGDDFTRQEVECQAERDGERQGRQSSSEDCQKHQGQAKADQDGYEAGQGRVPVAIRRSFSDLEIRNKGVLKNFKHSNLVILDPT